MELRLKNASAKATTAPTASTSARHRQHRGHARRSSDHPHYRSELQGENRGRGVALGFWGNGGMETSSSASVNADGTVNLVLGSVDIGGTRASLAMQLAETLGITAEDVNPKVVDTDSVGFTGNTGGSRTTFAGGWAAYELGMEIRSQLVERAAKIWECDAAPGDLRRRRRHPRPRRRRGQGAQLHLQGARGAAAPHRRHHRGRRQHQHEHAPAPAFGGHIVDVEVDPDTGKVDGPALHRRPGRRHGHPPLLRRGPDPGRRRAGRRHGAAARSTTTATTAACSTPASSTTACRPRSTCR